MSFLRRPSVHRTRRARSGFTLIEIAVAMVLLIIAIGGVSGALVSSVQLSRANEETAIADDAARRMAARLDTVPFMEIFATFNADPGDDPDGFDTAPGASFDVRGLTFRTSDPDGRVGEILFPTAELAGGLALVESVEVPLQGMPRDLNGDGLVDVGPVDRTDEYIVLPVTIRLEWRGASGNRRLELHAVLVE